MKDICLKEINKMFVDNKIEQIIEYLFNTSNFKNLYLCFFDKCQYNGEIIDITKLSKQQLINLK